MSRTMIEARRAPVRPRVLSFGSTTPVPLEDEVRALVETGARGRIAVLGPPGSGKTTALEHLAALFPDGHCFSLLDEPKLDQLADSPDCPLIYTAASPCPGNHLAIFQLAPWNRDDLIEYLLAVHRPRCAAVMGRVQPTDHLLIGGIAELWRIVLDRLAEDDELPTVRSALHRHLRDHLADTDVLERARSACLNAVVTPDASFSDKLIGLARPGFADGLVRLLRHPAMQVFLASERIAADLHGEADCDYLAQRLPRGLVEATGRLLAAHPAWIVSTDRKDGLVEATSFLLGGDERAREHLHALLAGPSWSHAMAASLLHAAGAGAGLRNGCPSQLAGAYLDGVSWPGVNLVGADLTETDLAAGDLREAHLSGAVAVKSTLRQARLGAAYLNEIILVQADLRGADLGRVWGERASFVAANLEKANFTSARLPRPRFVESNLTAAVFRDANLPHANFTGAVLKDADFTGANLRGAILSFLRLREAHWEGARFVQASLVGCDLEYMNLPAADFENACLCEALLTGSAMFGANFRGADLREAGLADIEWEGADLRGADLRGASFHMGSTRGGLVGSTIPCEGSRTGFYTDDYDEQTYKAPEEIRKANLCGADLRGAILDGVDFYLVDLRGALYDEKHEDHLRRCGAILEARV
jgi:uncharacterized protein YjbI with pentapeptide repeats/energy-coupling factor transporter ATP-binding protein EcfA2